MAQKFKMGSFGNNGKFVWEDSFVFNTNVSALVKEIQINDWSASLANFVNMKITLESGVYYFNVLDNNLASGTTKEKDVVLSTKPDFFPGVPSDNLNQLEFIGSDDVRQWRTETIDMYDTGNKKWLRISAGKQFKMKVENNKVTVVYES